MADNNDARLRILIEYIRDEAQAKAALADMDALGEKGKHAGHGINEAGEGVKYFNTHGRAMHKLIHQLDHMLPGTGILLRAAFHPDAVGIFALVLGIGLVHKAIEEYKKKLEEAHEAAIKADFAAGMEAALEATRSATNEQGAYIRNLEEIKRGEHGVAAEMASQLQLIAALKAAKEGQAEAEKTLALAKLKEDEILGRITESDAIIQKGQIEKKFVEDKAKAETENYKAQQKERTKALEEATAKEAELEKARDVAKQKLDAANLAKAAAKGAPTAEEVRKAQELADQKAEALERNHGVGLEEEVDSPQLKRLQADARNAQAKADLMQRQHNQQDQANKIDIAALEADEKEKEKAVKENAKALAAARDAIKNAAAVDSVTTGPKAATTRAQEGTIDAQTRTELIQRGRELQKEFQTKGAGMSQQDAAELLASLRGLGPVIVAAMDSKVSMAQLKSEMDALKRMIESKGK